MKRSLSLQGVAVSPGVALGRAVLWLSREDTAPRRHLEREEVPQEIERLRHAAQTAVQEIEATAGEVSKRIGPEYAAIFHAHAMLLRDRAFLGLIEKKIEVDAVNAEWAVAATAEKLGARFRDLPDEALAHRAADLDDVAVNLRKHLGDGVDTSHRFSQLSGEPTVLIADELSPTDAVKIPRETVVAFATERGGKTSHAAILARSFGIPAVVAVPRLLASVGEGDRVIVDGQDGVVWREPSEDVVALFEERRTREASRERSLRERSLVGPVRTVDGQEVVVRANIELASEAEDVLAWGADGVGLFRSEFLYLSTTGESEFQFLDEATQTDIYRRVVSRLAPLPVVIRTYDLGGKKGARSLVGAHEVNPVLGLRGVRLCLRRTEMFRTQLKALLASAAEGDLRILVPMVSGVEEIRRVRSLLDEAKEELLDRGVPVPDHVPLGAMVEVPSAALTADLIAPEVDFLSLGTNDLIQYTLAVDRANETVSELFRPHHPAILRLIARVVEACRAASRPLAVCGEMAADPVLFLLMLGLGIREFSMGPRSVPVAKEVARGISVGVAERIARAALSLPTPEEVAALLTRETHALESGDLLTRSVEGRT
ncbi:MAG: phosphoenolpyruvate--protein phosphotransferase [Acidobacteria bacterium]|nr:MAG: phosphoenolpyruvate--protein phosphotransferase [Acidobacteriota bacterium]MCE7958848.1 phosphoenolpyruvate--protein phosphotransferase [Acidobacteria bacterium ACB2]